MNIELKDFIQLISHKDRKELYLLLAIEFKSLAKSGDLMTIDFFVKNYDLSARLSNCLKQYCVCEYNTVFLNKNTDLVYVHQLKKEVVGGWKNIGKKSVDELFELLKTLKDNNLI